MCILGGAHQRRKADLLGRLKPRSSFPSRLPNGYNLAVAGPVCIEVIGPLLHHRPAFVGILRPVIRRAHSVLFSMGKLPLDHVRAIARLVQGRRGYGAKAVSRHPTVIAKSIKGKQQPPWAFGTASALACLHQVNRERDGHRAPRLPQREKVEKCRNGVAMDGGRNDGGGQGLQTPEGVQAPANTQGRIDCPSRQAHDRSET